MNSNYRGNLLPPIPISFGISAPQFITLHTVCSSSTQNANMIRRTSRVKSGRRRMYDRSLAGLNGKAGKVTGEFEGMVFSVCRARTTPVSEEETALFF